MALGMVLPINKKTTTKTNKMQSFFPTEIKDQTVSMGFCRMSPPPSPQGEGRGEVQKPLVSTTARKHV